MSTATQAEIWSVSDVDYHADTEHTTRSQLKRLRECPKKYFDEYIAKTVERKPPSDDMILGQCFHAYILEAQENWLVWRGGRRAGNEWSMFAAEAFAIGKPVLTVDQDDAIRCMADAMRHNSQVCELFEADGDNELAAHGAHESEIKVKCRWDRLLHDGRQVDLKVVGDSSPDFFASQVDKFGYDIQAAFYSQLATALGYDDPPFLFVTCHKNPPHECYVWELPTDVMELAHAEVDRLLYMLARRREQNDWADPLSNRINTIEMPRWYYTRRGR